jgi:hypothetical protein
MKLTAFFNITPCNLVKVDRRFRGTYCLHHQGNYRGSTHFLNINLLQWDYMALYPIGCFSCYNYVFVFIFVFETSICAMACSTSLA